MGKKNELAKGIENSRIDLFEVVSNNILDVRSQKVLLDSDVARLYGVETRRVNEAVKNNREKFPPDYMFTLTEEETDNLRSKISTANCDSPTANYTALSTKRRTFANAFTEKGLYMLATVLKSQRAFDASFAIIETFAKVRELKQGIKELHNEKDLGKQKLMMNHFGEILADVVSPELETNETESTLELNFIIGKVTHTVKRTKRKEDNKT